MVEFAIVLPLMLIVLAGIYTLARAQSQINILAQAAYQIALIGGTTTRTNGAGDDTMWKTGNTILDISRKQTNYLDTLTLARPSQISEGPPPTYSTAYFQDPDNANTFYVDVEVRGTVNSVFHYFLPSLFTLTVDVTAPYLSGSIAAASSATDGLQNPTTLLGCEGSGPAQNEACANKVCGCEVNTKGTCRGSDTPQWCCTPNDNCQAAGS